MYRFVSGDDGSSGACTRSDSEWTGGRIADAEEGADDKAGKPWFVESRHVRLMSFQARTKARMEQREISKGDSIFFSMESIETVSQRKEQYTNINKYEEGKKKVSGWVGYVSLLR